MKPKLEFFGQEVDSPIEIRKVKEFNERRRRNSPLEELFYSKWKEMLSENKNHLGLILNDGRTNHYVREYDEVMCAALIQWLATCVGSCFLRSLFESIDKGLGHEIFRKMCDYENEKKREKEDKEIMKYHPLELGTDDLPF
jgi:hypothetical protein